MATPKPTRPMPPDGASEPREKPVPKWSAPEPRRTAFGLRARIQTARGRTLRLLDRFGRWLVLLAVLGATVLLVLPDLFTQPHEYRVGEVVKDDVVARASFPVVDQKELDLRSKALAERRRYFYRFDSQCFETMARRVEDLFTEAARLRAAPAETQTEDPAIALHDWAGAHHNVYPSFQLASTVLRRVDTPGLSATLARLLRGLHKGVVDDLTEYRKRTNLGAGRIVIRSQPADLSLQPNDVIEVREIRDYLTGLLAKNAEDGAGLSAEDQDLAVQLAQLYAYALPNLVYDVDATKRELDAKIENLRRNPPSEIYRVYKKGYVLAQSGEMLDASAAELIRQMQASYDAMHLKKRLAIVLYMVLLHALVFYYIRIFRPDIAFTAANVLLVGLPVLIALAFGCLALAVVDAAKFPDAAGYAFPSAIVGMLCVILLDSRSAVLLVTIASLAFSVRAGLDFKVFLVSLFGGYVAVTALTRVQERKEVLKAGLVVGAVNAAAILLIHLIDDPRSFRWNLLAWGVGNGLACGIVAMPALVVFERLFGVVTDIGLLEITGLDHPLLMDLEEKVPGSFQHSLNVCKLAEAAARAVGANYLLVRAGAYYHDVGKISKPKYFSENQISLEDKSIHSRVSPNMSAMIIRNHVKAGMEMARRHGLPERVIDFIPQHHGTTIIAFFYHEALRRFENSQTTDPVREEDFRYPGPKPQSIETAIVMVADAAEATVTSRFTSLTVNEDELRMCVQKTITDKFADGQFDECDMTLRDLHEIRESFVRTLLTRFHHRVAYPTKPARSGPASPAQRRDRMERE